MLPEVHKVLELLEAGFGALRVLVVGDVMIDRYIVGEVERISPEAPVPVLRQARQYARPGGAANVAMNLTGLGLQTVLAGFVGNDAAADELRELMSSSSVDVSRLVVSSLPTIAKNRLVTRTQQLMRIDVESRDRPNKDDEAALLKNAVDAVAGADAVILSDYAKGALTGNLCRAVITAANAAGIPVLADPKSRDFSKYAGATTVCPNLSELSLATGVDLHSTEALLNAGRSLLQTLDIAFLTVTMSEKGIRILQCNAAEEYHSPARAREVFDVSGAGDTVIATLAAGLAGGLSITSAVELANIAAGIVVAKVGTVPIAAHEIVSELTVSSGVTSAEKVLLTRDRAVARVREWKASGETIVFTNGCFDLLHIGHVTLLEECRRFGSKLVVAMNTDRSVSALKGHTRPIVGEKDRTRVMAALGAVDLVTLFDEETPLELIQAMKPDVLVKGGDYAVDTVVGHEIVLAAGGRVEIVPTVEGFSTSSIVKKMTESATA